jgi:DNA-binding Lrp family transcriptional regulator
MAASAYVLVNLSGRETRGALERIKKIKGVESANIVAGPFDLIIHVKGKNLEEIGELVISKIRKSPGVINTVTCYIVA